MRQHFGLVAAAGIAALTATTAANAGGFFVREHSTAAMGSAFAGASAYGHDPSYMFYNPATIADVTGTAVTLDGRMFFPDVSIHADEATSPFGMNILPLGDSGSMAEDAFAPAIYATHQIDGQTTIGIGFSGPFAVILETKPSWAGQFQLLKTKMVGWNLEPVVSRRVNERFAIAFGLNIQGMDVDLQRMEAIPFIGAAPGFLRGDDVGVGWSAGATWDPLPGTRIGVGFRSQITHHLRGKAGLTDTPLKESVSFNLVTPAVVSLGIEQQVTEKLTLLGEVEWSNWSAFDGFQIRFDSGRPDNIRAQDWDDTWFFSLGGRYQATGRTSVSAGVGYEQAVSNGGTNTISPDGDRTILGLGLTHELWPGMTLAASYAHIWFADGAIEVADAQGTFKGAMSNDLDVVGVSLTGRW